MSAEEYRVTGDEPIPVEEVAAALRTLRCYYRDQIDSPFVRGASQAVAEAQQKLRIHPNEMGEA